MGVEEILPLPQIGENMKKYSLFLALLLSVILTIPAFAAVAIEADSVPYGTATTLNFSSANTVTTDGSTYTIDMTTTGLVGAITSGTIDGAVIGGSSAAAGSFTTIAASGAVALSGNSTLGNAVTDINTITGKIAGATPLTFDGTTANTVYTILAVDDPASSSKTVTLPAVTGTVKLTGAAVALTPGTAVALTVAKGTTLYTDTITTDNENQEITFSAGGSAGDEITIIFVTDTGGSGDEVITFHGTLVRSTGTLTLANATASRYLIRFISDGTKWNEVSRTAVQAA